MTTPIANSKGIPPSDYTRYLERVAANHEAQAKQSRRDRMVRRLTWACWISVAVIIAVVAWREFA